jgi:hypothetical protein
LALVFGNQPAPQNVAYFLEVNCENNWQPNVVISGQPLSWITPNKNAIIVQSLEGNKAGTNTFDLNKWRSTSTSKIEHWQVSEGKLEKKITNNIECSLKSVSVESNQTDFEPNVDQLNRKINFRNVDAAYLYSMDGKQVNACTSCQSLAFVDLQGLYIISLIKDHQTKSFKVLISNQ